MPSPYQLKLNIERMQNMLKRLWEQKRFAQAQHLFRTKQLNDFNEKMIRFNQIPKQNFQKKIQDPKQNTLLRLRPTPNRPKPKTDQKQRVLNASPKQKSHARNMIQHVYVHLLNFFAQNAQIRKKIALEKLAKKRADEEILAEKTRVNRLEP